MLEGALSGSATAGGRVEIGTAFLDIGYENGYGYENAGKDGNAKLVA